MSILAIDMLTRQTHIALDEHSRSFENSPDQAELLPSQIQSLLFDYDVSFADLTAVLVLTGPGSFTGVRVALSSAHAIGMALNVPLIGMSADEAYALMIDKEKSACLVLDTRRKDFAVAYKEKGENHFSSFEELLAGDIKIDIGVICGNGAEKAGLKADIANIDLCGLIKKCSVEETEYNSNKASVFYLRDPDVTLSKQKFEHQALYKAQ